MAYTITKSGGRTVALADAEPENDAFITAILDTDPWGLWTLDEASGDALDSSGNGNDGTWSGSIAERQASGCVPNVPEREGVRLNGTTGDAFATVPYSEARGTITMLACVKTSDAHAGAFGRCIGFGATGITVFQSDIWTLFHTDETSSGSDVYDTTFAPDGNPGLAIVVMGADLLKVWVNGVLEDDVPSAQQQTAPVVADIVIGAKNGSNEQLTGTLGPVAFWNREIEDEEAEAIYAAWAGE